MEPQMDTNRHELVEALHCCIVESEGLSGDEPVVTIQRFNDSTIPNATRLSAIKPQ
jgi:hypothetical protein